MGLVTADSLTMRPPEPGTGVGRILGKLRLRADFRFKQHVGNEDRAPGKRGGIAEIVRPFHLLSGIFLYADILIRCRHQACALRLRGCQFPQPSSECCLPIPLELDGIALAPRPEMDLALIAS